MRSLNIRRFLIVAGVHAALSLALQAFLLSCHAPATVWPPAGISLGFLLIWGRQYWLAVSIGAFVCYQQHDGISTLSAALLALVSGSAAWMGAWAIERVGRVRLTLPTVRDMALLAVGGLAVAPLWSALGATLVLIPTQPLGDETLPRAMAWWFTESLGALAFTPLVVAWHGVRDKNRRGALERALFMGATFAVVAALLFVNVGFSSSFAVIALSVVPLVLWGAKRCGMRCTMTLNATIALATAIGFTSGAGLFALSGGPMGAQLFTAWTVIISLIFASSVRERELVVEQLEDSEKRLTSVLNSSQDQIALLAVANGQISSLEIGNHALFSGLRVIAPDLEPQMLIGRSDAEISALLAVSLQTLAPLNNAVNAAINMRRSTQGTFELKTQWGDRVLEATAVPITHEGAVTHVVWQSRDVTDRVHAERSLRASEARWRTLIEASPQYIMLVDSARRLKFINRVADGFSLSQVVGTCIDEYMVDDHSRAVLRENLASVFERGETRSYEIQGYGPQQAPAWYRCDAGPVWDQGRVMSAMIIASDITDQKRAEAARQQLEQQLYQSQKMEALGTLAGGIAHDFNNVLAGIMANAELLRDVVAHDAEGEESIRDILAAGRRARDVVRQILAFSRRQPLERRAVRLSDVILEAMTLLRASLPSTIRLRTTVRAAEVLVLADETQLHQVVMNLATNAAQAIGNKEGEIEFDAAAIEVGHNPSRTPSLAPTTDNGDDARPNLPPGRYAKLVVRDNGPGMDRSTLDRIFDPFFTTKPMGQGTGLGLAVVHGIVTGHNGAIVAQSEVGRGTSMSIFLPLYSAPAAATPTSPPLRAIA
ncbi:MAG TPA: ATP-binding protein [Gemmatimonadaceae bacterium]|nr:ATP-binding protein [Gemmatimonadaceae bacterium]